MTRSAAKNAPQEPVDPLADLREPDDAQGAPGATQEPQEGPEEPSVDLVTQVDWDAARERAIAAWHADTVALGFLHKGGRCGCHYLSGVALTAVMPVGPDLDPEEPGADDTPED